MELRIEGLTKQFNKMIAVDHVNLKLEKGVIGLLDDVNAARKKIMSAVTDDYGKVKFDEDNQPGISNLMSILSKITNESFESIEKRFEGKGYGEFKKEVADVVCNLLEEIQARFNKYNDKKIDYKVMMSNPSITHSEEVSALYDKLIKQYRHMINMKDEYVDNLRYVACSLRNEFLKFGYSEETICDMLVEYLYKGKKRYKQLLWFCYGQYIVNNLEKQFGKRTKFIQCIDCDEWFEVDISSKKIRCDKCNEIHRKQTKLDTWNKNKEKYRGC